MNWAPPPNPAGTLFRPPGLSRRKAEHRNITRNITALIVYASGGRGSAADPAGGLIPPAPLILGLDRVYVRRR
jgi:hypothetical protein